MPRDLEGLIGRGDDEVARAQVQERRDALEGGLFLVCEVHVRDDLARGHGAPAQVDQGGRPGARGEDGQVGLELGAVGQLDAADLRGALVVRAAHEGGGGPVDEVHAPRGADLGVQPVHAPLGVGPA